METVVQEPVVEPVTDGALPVNGVQVLPLDEYNRTLVGNAHPPDWVNPTPASSYNLVIIGGGSAGLLAAVGAAGLGAKVAVIERYLLGGDCLNVGCVPSKTVIRSAKVVGEILEAQAFGIHAPAAIDVDFAAVMARMRRVRAEISHHDSAERFRSLGIDLFLGEGRFGSPTTVGVVNGEQKSVLAFKKALIATGSRPMSLPIPGLAEAGYLTNITLFELTERPQRLAVIGAGPIGAELAQSFRRFGSEVMVFDVVPRLLGREDPDAAAVLKGVFEREGIRLALGAKIERVGKGAAGKTIQFELDGRQETLTFDEILVAAGRTPNIDTLNLEAAGVEYHNKGVQVDDTLRTTNPSVYAAGDVAIKYQFTHTADATARMVLQNALFPGPKKKVSNLIIPWCTYTDPEVAHVGLYEQEAQEQGIAIETFVVSTGDVDRGRADGETEGFLKVHVKQGSDQIVGATMVARHAGEMINILTLAMTTGVGLKGIATMIFPYPTQAEVIKKVADSYNRTRLTPLVKGLFTQWFRWTR
ncbi:MAG: mercuric reductase [Caldilineaceae bacterium]|nr:mercuric reductase [Caldilineaceae bacterium]